MIKITFCLHRRPTLSREEFFDYWLNKHGPLVRSHRETLKIRRYVQLHSLTGEFGEQARAARGAPEPFDGVAELWWDSLEDLSAGFNEPEGRAAGKELLEDERKFIDLARSPLWFSEERILIE